MANELSTITIPLKTYISIVKYFWDSMYDIKSTRKVNCRGQILLLFKLRIKKSNLNILNKTAERKHISVLHLIFTVV